MSSTGEVPAEPGAQRTPEPAFTPGRFAGRTAIVAAAGVLGPMMQTMIPPVATAEQLAATITWLLSDDASNVNGAILPSDGGWSAI
jgi:NAD(P)-dependent dehydrogenase (short-subunit alcohol dehydrogenase family)